MQELPMVSRSNYKKGTRAIKNARVKLKIEDIAVLMLVKCIRVVAIWQFALRSIPHQVDNCYSDRQL